mmetsp:Transcript_90641/g.255548  ORF Transcript_90641/g.255548 Transcript_90641/m.255548 type:complete len:295 (-) Transcript_90641:55-939(-)
MRKSMLWARPDMMQVPWTSKVGAEDDDNMCVSEVSQTEVGSWQNRRGGTKRWSHDTFEWCLIWCHERCHKLDRASVREELWRMASAAGGRLCCMKKGQKYADWAKSSGLAQGTPHVLLTDWREAKPCLEKMACMAGAFAMPSAILLLNEDPKHEPRIRDWAESVVVEGMFGPIQVVVPQTLGRELAAFGASLLAAASTSTPAAVGAGPGAAGRSGSRNDDITLPDRIADDDIGGAFKGGAVGPGVPTAPRLSWGQHLNDPAVAKFMESFFAPGQRNPQDIEVALTAAMPTHYED